MSNLLLILATETKVVEEIESLLTSHPFQVLVSAPPAELPESVFSRLFLVMVADEGARRRYEQIEHNIPDHVPALILSNVPPNQENIEGRSNGRLVDWLNPDSLTTFLSHRINFLRRVALLSLERDSLLRNHDNTLDLLASRDGLTGLYNRHHFNKVLAHEFTRYRDDGSDLSLIFINIDFFQEINRTKGQSFGDSIINEIAARLTGASRDSDTCFRFSSGDFVILMPDTSAQAAKRAAEEIFTSCTGRPFTRNGSSQLISISMGIASAVPLQPATMDEFIQMGENALYKAKASGRGQIHLLPPAGGEETGPIEHNFETVKFSINKILEKTRTSAIDSLQLLARDIAGPAHRDHLERVTRYTELLSKQLGLPPAITLTLNNALILYSSVRYFLHSDLLTKKANFSDKDWELLKDYPYKLSEIVDIFDYFAQERYLLTTRSENFDGSGYPEGLCGYEIPLGARILNIVDSFAAMMGSRPHRPKLTPGEILTELKEQAGKQFDPFLVIQFLDIIGNNTLLDIDAEELAEIRAEIYHHHFEQKP